MRRFAALVRKILLRAKWRRHARRQGGLRLKISGVQKFLSRLDGVGIHYVVLRWPEEVPIDEESERNYPHDIDLLADFEHLDELSEIAASQHGTFDVDLYNISGRKGANYLRMPYFPPVFACEILNSRARHRNGFFVSDPKMYFWSFAYHLVYHKGLLSGMPSGCSLRSDPCPKRNYAAQLVHLAEKADQSIPDHITLLAMHRLLKQANRNMSLDLLIRWPRQTPWHRFLLEQERNLLEPWARKLPELAVFFIREELGDSENVKKALSLLSKKFEILRKVRVESEMEKRIMMQVRGGNWISLTTNKMSPPVWAVICYDLNPDPFLSSDEMRDAYPHVTNKNMLYKLSVRDALNTLNQGRKLNALHGSDNALEAQHMLAAIFGVDKSEQENREILSTLPLGDE